jgi:hypothetical protein
VSFDMKALSVPPTPTAALALEVAARWCSTDLLNHSIRSWIFARTLGDSLGIAYDAELLYVASLLHDIGVTEHFDAHEVPFETAGGAVGWVFAAGAGWDALRRDRVLEVIERHMWVSVEPDFDPEGHLLEVATSLDVAGAGTELWSRDLELAVATAFPRGEFSESFEAQIHAQARRKPTSSAARLDASGRVAAGGAQWSRMLGSA